MQRADRDFMRLAREHYENFPVGSWLVPRAQRKHIHRIYAFARTADDIADEMRDARALEDYRALFVAHVTGDVEPVEPMFADLAETIHELDLPLARFVDLLDAFARDLTVGRYADDAALFDYCRRSADPVGRLVLRVFGHRDDRLDAWSDSICTGLQLLNHLQDLGSDFVERDRVYFPQADLDRFGVEESMLGEPTAPAPVRRLVAFWLDRTVESLRRGWPLTGAVHGRLRFELRAVVGGAAAVAVAIRAADYDVLGRRCRLGRWAKARGIVPAVLSSRIPRGIA